MENVIREIKQLFDDARTKHEFQFLLTILNYKHVANPLDSSNLYEWFDAIEFYKTLYSKHESNEKVRVGLLLYSTFFENSDFYNIIGSLCKNTMGFQGSSFLFWKTKKLERLLGTGEKIRMVSELLNDCNYNEILAFFSTVHLEQIRNTFFHSAYSIKEGYYLLFDSEPIVIGTKNTNRISIVEFLLPLIDSVIQFFDTFKQNYLASFDRYTADVAIKGYFPTLKDVIIHGTPDGLKGMTIKKTAQFYGEWADSGIYWSEEYQFWMAKNININFPQIERIEIDETLKRYEAKEDIQRDTTEFFNLVEKIAERNFYDTEIVRTIHLLIKFGDVRYLKWETEQNDRKKPSLKKWPLPFYEKAIQLNKHWNLSKIIERKNELETQ